MDFAKSSQLIRLTSSTRFKTVIAFLAISPAFLQRSQKGKWIEADLFCYLEELDHLEPKFVPFDLGNV